MGCETVVYLHAQQRIRVLAVAPEELLYGGTHVVIGHHARSTPQLPIAVAVGFHKSQGIFARKQICLAHIAVVEGEYRHVKASPDSTDPQGKHAPVELATESRLIVLTDICLCRLFLRLRRCLQRTDILTYCGIGDTHAIVLKTSPHIELAHLLLVQSGSDVLTVAGDKTIDATADIIGHDTPDASAAVILRPGQQIIVNLPLCR